MAGAWRRVQRLPRRYDGFRLLVDVRYATPPRLLKHVAADEIDAVLVGHGTVAGASRQ
jgi:hypothetical protein